MSFEHSREDEGSLVIDIHQIGVAFRSKWQWAVAVPVVFALMAALYGYLIFEESYHSSAKLLLDVTDAPKFVSNLDTDEAFLKGSGSESSPYKNQEELLKSQLIFNRVADTLKKDHIRVKYKKPVELSEKVFSAEHIKNTNFIRIAATANKPDTAQTLAQLYMQSYLDLMNEISYTPLKQKRKLFETEVARAENELAGINRKIELYQETYGILDINIESQNQIRQLVNLDSQKKAIQADLAEKQAEVSRIRKQLKLKRGDFDDVVQAVAKGQDSTLVVLQEKLQDLQKDYDSKALIYAPTNPDMVQLQRKLDVLKAQIIDQQILTVGHGLPPRTGQIKDSVRTDMVNRLALADSESAALQNKLGTLYMQYDELKGSLKGLPQQQLEYARLSLDKKNREDLLTRLKQNLAEAQMQEASVRKRLMVIDPPNLPEKPVAPLRWHIILGAAAAGLLLASSAIVGQSLINQKYFRPEYIEKVLDAPVLGCIPWLTDDQWRFLRHKKRLEVTATDVDPGVINAYQDLALNLKVRRNVLQKNTAVLSQLLTEKGHAVVLANLAFCLAQGGERVILIDADLRNPGLHEAFNHALDYERGLPELINAISELMHRKKDVQVEDILQLVNGSVTPSGIHPQLEYLNAGLSLNNTFEFLNAKSFDILLNVLKASYDWVLVSAPPILSHPDCAVLLGYVDGLLILSDLETEELQMAAVQRKVERIGSMTYGAILRNLSV